MRTQQAAPAAAPRATPAAGFRIGGADDAAEREADAVADRVLGGVLRRKCAACGEEETLRRRSTGNTVAGDAPRAVAAALAEGGRPLPANEAAFFGSRLGAPLDGVRVHDGPAADRAARSVGASAFALGHDIVFARGEFRPQSAEGRRLLAHELAHVTQAGATTTLRRFTRAEEGDISTLDEVIDQARARAASTGVAGLMRWGRFVAANGGSAAGEVIARAAGGTGSTARTNSHRYLFTCLCGLVDMRHFFQLMYAGLLEGNVDAVQRGRNHELEAEPTSRFAAEDTPSNALGAYFGSEQSAVQRQSVFVANLRAFLGRCHPIDYDALPAAQRTQILDWYAVDGTNAPAHQNEQAYPNMARIPACGSLGMFPFVVDGTTRTMNRIVGTVE